MSKSFVESWKKSIIEEMGYNTKDMKPFLEAIKDNAIFTDWVLTVPCEFITDGEMGLRYFLDTLECANHETVDNSDFSLLYFYITNGIHGYNEAEKDFWLSYSIEQGEFGKVNIKLFMLEKQTKYLVNILDLVLRESEHIGFFDFDENWEPMLEFNLFEYEEEFDEEDWDDKDWDDEEFDEED